MASTVLSIAMLVSFLSGCSSSTNTSVNTTVPPTTTQVPVTTAVTTTAPVTTTSTVTQSQAVTVNIAAAASLTDALKAINTLYVQANQNVTLTPSFASSGTLQTQIENGAPCDIFISAAATQMNNLQKENLILR